MEANFQRALALVLKHEGGFSNHKDDPGGATNKGITLATFRKYVKPGGTVADLKAITDAQVAQVYKRHYWDAVKGDQLPSGIDYTVFDFAVNSGPSRAVKFLQRIIMVRQDGIIGPQTLAQLAKGKPEHVIEVLCAERLKFLQGLKTWPTFGKGWTNRVNSVVRDATAMVNTSAKPAVEKASDIPPEILMPDHRVSIWARILTFFLERIIPRRK